MALDSKKVKSAGGSNTPDLEPGNYPARVVQVLDLGLQAQRPFQGKEKPPMNEIMVTYELGTEFLLDEEGNELKDKPRWLSETFPLHNMGADRAKSTKRMKSLDPSNKLDGDFSQLPSTPCTITVVINPDKKVPGKVYTNVGDVTPPMKGFPVPDLVNEPRTFDMDDPDLEVFSSLPEWIQDKMKGNLEYQGSALQAALEGTEFRPREIEEGEESEDNPY